MAVFCCHKTDLSTVEPNKSGRGIWGSFKIILKLNLKNCPRVFHIYFVIKSSRGFLLQYFPFGHRQFNFSYSHTVVGFWVILLCVE